MLIIVLIQHLENEEVIKITREKSLTVGELLTKVYIGLKEKSPYKIKTIVLPKAVFTEIEDHSDPRQTRFAYMKYLSLVLIQLDKTWAIGLGEVSGGDAAGFYNKDILAIEIPNNVDTERLTLLIKESICFENSLVFGMENGSLEVALSSRFFHKITKLKQRVEKHILKLGSNRSTSQPIMRYKENLVPFLIDSIVEILNKA